MMNRQITFRGTDVGDAADIDFDMAVEVDENGLVIASPLRETHRAVKQDAWANTTTNLTTISGLSIVATADGGTYDLALHGPLVLSATDLFTGRLVVLEDGTEVLSQEFTFPHFGAAVGVAEGMALPFSVAKPITPTAGEHTYTVQSQRTAGGAGTMIGDGAAIKPWVLELTPIATVA